MTGLRIEIKKVKERWRNVQTAKKARTKHAKLLFFMVIMQICEVLAAFVVVVA